MNYVRTAMLLAALTAIFMGVGYLVGGSGGVVIAFLIAAGMNLFSYWNADKMVLSMHHAREVDASAAPQFYGIVHELAERADLPMPRVYVMDNPQPNAFATGRNPQNAAVAATTGLLATLTREEVAGVIAHELAHIKHRDTLTMTITATIAGAISMLASFAFWFGGSRDSNNPLGLIGVLIAAIVAPFAAMLVQMAVSRTREYAADRGGAEICGRPDWLASALARECRRRAQPGDSASVHRQPAIGSADGQPVLHSSSDREPDCRLARHGGGRSRSPGVWIGATHRLRRVVERGPAWSLGVSVPRRPPAHRISRTDEAPPGVAARVVAVALYGAVLDRHQPLDQLLDPLTGDGAFRALPSRDRRLVHAIVATALRRRGEIEAALDYLIERPLPRRVGGLRHILEIAATQLLFMEVADHAVVSVALEQLGTDRNARHFKGLANAVLRRLSREKETIRAGLDAARLDTPDWLWQRWTKTYGERTARKIAEMHLVEPSLDLSVKSDPEGWAARLGGIVLPTGSVRLVTSGPIEELSGYADGQWWVQDAAAALPARLLGPVGGMRVADLCAAPGGKTAALAYAGARVSAIDSSDARLNRLRANLARLDLEAETIVADVLNWAPGELYDRILLDSPCTATGTIRRHPDIARVKQPQDVAALATLQARMLDRAVDLLRPGGILVYCTCSLEPEEGEAVFEEAVRRHDLTPLPVLAEEIGGLDDAITPAGMVRTLPCHFPLPEPRLAGLDGFFIGRCRKD